MPHAIILPGAGPGAGPYMPPNLHGAGVAGFTRRYVADRVNAAPGALVPEVRDLAGTLHLTSATNTALRVGTFGSPARRYVGRTAAAGAVGGNVFNATAQAYVPTTVAAVVRAETLSVFFLQTQGLQLRRAANGAWQWAGSLSGGSPAATGSSNWALIFGLFNHGPNTAQIAVDGSTPATATAFATAAGRNTYIGANSAATVEVAELITWPSLLDATQRAAVRTALKAHYSALP